MFGATGSASAASASAAAASAAAGAAAAKNYAGYSLHRNTTSSHGGSSASSYNNYYRPTAHYGWVAPQPWVPVPQSAPVLTDSLAATPSALPQDFYRGSRLRTGATGVATAVPVIAPLVAAAAAMPPVALPVLATSSTRPLPVDADDEPFRYCPSPRMFPTATTSSLPSMAVSVAQAACASSGSGAHPLLQFSSGSTGTLLPPTVGCSQPMADVSSTFNIQALSTLLQRCHDRSSTGSPTQHSLTE
jgi:hypothetical protein